MILNSVILAVEDELGEAISTKILNSFDVKITVILREGGNPYLREKAPELNKFANGMDIFLFPLNTDNIPNPKEFLVPLARRSKKRRLRDELVPEPGAKIPVGYGYNTRLMEFIREHWNLERAATISPSLKRTLDRLSESKYAGTNQ